MRMMSEISSKQWDFITRENLSAKDAVDFLRTKMQVRTFAGNMREISQRNDFDKVLADELYRIKLSIGESSAQLDSIKRKVRNWMNGKNLPSDREEVFQICFAMEFDLAQSEKLLVRLTEQGIHYRNAKETVYAYALKYHQSYKSAVIMAEQLFGQKNEKEKCNDPMTQMIKAEFQKVRGEEDLFTFIMNNRMHMGNGHNTAYSYFTKMLSLLVGGAEDEEKYSLEYIAENYLRLNVPVDKKTSGYTNAQKIVKKYWPGARNIKAMKSRSEDVNRKTLLLLYIVTGGMWDEGYSELDEEYMDTTEFLEIHCNRMNQMLEESGMSRIDPRNMFDYVILYCLRPEDDIFMSERMEMLMDELY